MPFLLQVTRSLNRGGWSCSLWRTTSDHPGPSQSPCLAAVRSRCYQKECSSWLYRLYISHFSSLQKTPSAVVTMYRGTALWTTVNPESSICYWQKTLRCSRCRLLLGLLRSYRYDPAVVALTVASWEWNAAHITFHLTLISQMFIILPSAFLPCLLLWISSLSCYSFRKYFTRIEHTRFSR